MKVKYEAAIAAVCEMYDAIPESQRASFARNLNIVSQYMLAAHQKEAAK